MSHVAHMNESCRMSMSHVAHMNESCLACSHVPTSRLMSHTICMSHVTCQWAMSHIWMSQVSHAVTSWHLGSCHINESCHILMSHVTYQWAMSQINESCHTYECVTCTPHTVWVCDVTSTIHVTNQWIMSHIWMSHVTHMNESCVCIHVSTSRRMSEYPTYSLSVWCHINDSCHKAMNCVTHMNESCHTHECVICMHSRPDI